MYEKQSTRERRQQTYELIETVLRPDLTLPQDFLCLNHRITFRGHTRGFGVNFHLRGLLIRRGAISRLHCREDRVFLRHKHGRAAKSVPCPQHHRLSDTKDLKYH